MAHVRNHESAILNAEVAMRKVGQHCHNLILISKSSDKRADRSTSSKIMEQLELILDPMRTARDVNLLQRNVAALLPSHRLALDASPFGRRCCPAVLLSLAEDVPVIVVVIIQQVLCLVNCGKSPFTLSVNMPTNYPRGRTMQSHLLQSC